VKEAVGKNTKWNGKLPAPSLALPSSYVPLSENRAMSFDIFKRDRRGKHILLAVVGDLQTARIRLSELASRAPGEYFVFDSRIQQIVAAVLR